MAILEILTYPNKNLKKKSVWVEAIDRDLIQLALDMLETMYKAPGIGLAAPQVGVRKRMIVMDVTYSAEEEPQIPETLDELIEHETCRAFVNPEILLSHPMALLPSSPVLIRTHFGRSRTKILPSPIWPVRAPLTIASIVSPTKSSFTATSILTFLSRLTSNLMPR